MSGETDYDEIIAPMLLAVARKCEELGMTLIARVEWADGESGITQTPATKSAGIGQRLTQLAAHSHGNIDLLCIEAMKRFDCTQSAILSRFASTHNPIHNSTEK